MVDFLLEVNIVPLEPEPVMSTPTYDPFVTETTKAYKSKLFLCQMGHKKKKWHSQFWL